MKLKVLASGSKANSYILETDTEALLVEAGVPFKEILRNVDHKKIVGCLVTHEHKDHAKYVDDYRMYGVEVFAPFEDEDVVEKVNRFSYGGFDFIPFENYHDVACYGYKIYHEESGAIIFSTDTGYIKYKFQNIRHWLIECNYSKEILDQRVQQGFNPVLADRIVRDHMSLETCKEFFMANDMAKTLSIVLLHLSDANSHAEQFEREVHQITKKPTYIADKGLEIDISLCPF